MFNIYIYTAEVENSGAAAMVVAKFLN